MRKLVLLNSIFSRAEDYFGEIPQQRLVFFVQHIVQQMLGKASSSSMVGGQIMAILYFVLPRLSEIYGPFWAQILDEVQTIGPQAKLYALHSGLRLLSLLGKLHVQEANDDLVDAWVERKGALANYLVNLLRQRAGKSTNFIPKSPQVFILYGTDFPDASHQPGMITNELLHRKLLGMSETVKVQVQDLYPVLTSESSALQSTVYELLHQKIPSDQEQVSLTKALSPEYLAQLPEELFSLVLAAPSKKSPAEQSFERNIPSSLRTYLLSWLLIFDHWENASYKVQADYVAALKEGRYAHEFLEFALYFLISARSKPVDASKFDIERTMLGGEETPEKETQWALIRIYYLCLRHLPSITKEWWRDSASRQLSIAVEAWTQKHISPAIITKELSIISDWASSQATADQPMNIKVSQSAREITASIPIDEQTMTIAIRLPPSYPLARAEVESVHRVAVAEKKWRFWIINAQGVINFSSGGAGEGNSIIDGLMAWRNNVTAAMKGQTECAICYSVVSADRQLPSKKCSTCKNTFHSSCLFKWFKSSNSSSCPLCRNAFNYS